MWGVDGQLCNPQTARISRARQCGQSTHHTIGCVRAALPALAGATLLGRVTPAAAQDVLLIAYVFANLAVMYALAWTLTRQIGPSALAAVTFGLSPYVGVHMLGHFDLVAAWTIPLFA